METTTVMMDNANDTTRQSSKLSLGSSPSVLSADEQLEGDGPLTPTEKMQDDEEDDDDDLSALILQAGSPGSLSNEEVSDEDDLHTEQDSASPLSSVPDDFPLSRSNSPEPMITTPISAPLLAQQQTEEEEEEEEEDSKRTTRKRRKETHDDSSPTALKKAKQNQDTVPMEEVNKKRRASRSITNNIIIEPISTRPRRGQTRQEDQIKMEVQEQEKPIEEEEEEEEDEDEDKSNEDEEEEEGEEEKPAFADKDMNDEISAPPIEPEPLQSSPLQNLDFEEDIKMNHVELQGKLKKMCTKSILHFLFDT